MPYGGNGPAVPEETPSGHPSSLNESSALHVALQYCGRLLAACTPQIVSCVGMVGSSASTAALYSMRRRYDATARLQRGLDGDGGILQSTLIQRDVSNEFWGIIA